MLKHFCTNDDMFLVADIDVEYVVTMFLRGLKDMFGAGLMKSDGYPSG